MIGVVTVGVGSVGVATVTVAIGVLTATVAGEVAIGRAGSDTVGTRSPVCSSEGAASVVDGRDEAGVASLRDCVDAAALPIGLADLFSE